MGLINLSFFFVRLWFSFFVGILGVVGFEEQQHFDNDVDAGFD
jgi:hypothetical protein